MTVTPWALSSPEAAYQGSNLLQKQMTPSVPGLESCVSCTFPSVQGIPLERTHRDTWDRQGSISSLSNSLEYFAGSLEGSVFSKLYVFKGVLVDPVQ